ncbi:glycosyltransferase [Halostagnicola larsenii]|uniref:glycosyltransferase n=1 Tax=Halostagnicola larsenii TaxID=353800 RepID=UPI0009FF6114|nr:glycosyltransferase [Halostagnicola larsenii]
MTDGSFSVLISVYENDDPEHLDEALRSIVEQSVEPEEIVLVADGPLPSEIEQTIEKFTSAHPNVFTLIQLDSNQGLGIALQTGLKKCSHDLVARMDADDISEPHRFETQVSYLLSNPNIDVVGSNVGEFYDNPDNIKNVRKVPSSAAEVRSMAQFRSPTNHPSVMFRRSSVLEAGNYRSYRSMQDYELWVRMLSQGYTIENIPEVLVKCRASNDLYERRGGVKYSLLELEIQREFLRMDAISRVTFLRNIAVRVPVRLLPNSLRSLIYRTFLRDGVETNEETSRI